MASTNDSGLGHRSGGVPQTDIEEQAYPEKAAENEEAASDETLPRYVPSPKHNPVGGWGSSNPISSQNEGQRLIETGYRHGRQIFNITDRGELIKYQPDGTPQNGFHPYIIRGIPEIPVSILRQMLRNGDITKVQYNRFRKGKG